MQPTNFLYLLTPPRPTFLRDATPDEMAIMGKHRAYLEAAVASGRLMLAGPTLDGVYGVGILATGDMAEAEGFAAGDPVVSSGLMQYRLHPWMASIRAPGL